MDIETIMFSFADVVKSSFQSQELGANKPPRKGGVKAATVFCKGCRYKWRAVEGDESFASAWGGRMFFSCPECDAQEEVTLARFDEIS